MTIIVTKLNAEGDPIENPKEFATVEQGQKWAEQDRGQPLEWGEEGRFFSLEGMTKAEVEALGEAGDYPPVRYWLSGLDGDGTPRELEDEDFEAPDTIELTRN